MANPSLYIAEPRKKLRSPSTVQVVRVEIVPLAVAEPRKTSRSPSRVETPTVLAADLGQSQSQERNRVRQGPRARHAQARAEGGRRAKKEIAVAKLSCT